MSVEELKEKGIVQNVMACVSDSGSYSRRNAKCSLKIAKFLYRRCKRGLDSAELEKLVTTLLQIIAPSSKEDVKEKLDYIDYTTIKLALSLLRIICFHNEACREKIVKAFYISLVQ